MTTAQLSATSLPSQNTNMQTSALPAASGTGSGINWALAAVVTGGLIIIVGLIWQIASRHSSPKIRKPVDLRIKKRSRAKFCRNCGEPIDEGDRFCRECGSEL
jgi:hypothetical protein